VTGIVIEADSERSMSEVTVSFRSTGSEFRTEVDTDSLGRFALDSLPLGFGLLHASRFDYAAPGIAVTVNPEHGHEATFVMAPSRPSICPTTGPA